MLSVANRPIVLSVIMLNVVLLNVMASFSAPPLYRLISLLQNIGLCLKGLPIANTLAFRLALAYWGGFYNTGPAKGILFRHCIFSHLRPFYEQAVSSLDPWRSMHRPD
jgi:hypothetical protein